MSAKVGLAALALLLAAGCISKPPRTAKPKTDRRKEQKTRQIGLSGEGSELRSGDPPKRAKLWSVHWKTAELSITGSTGFSGVLHDVTGSLYRDEIEVSTYAADRAFADKENNILRLTGHIVVKSKNPQATLSCDRMEWLPERKLIRANGHIRVASANGTMEGLDEALATPDLRKVGTPDVFPEP